MQHQLEIKRERVERSLRAAPGLAGIDVLPTMPSRMTSGYRNHARFTIGPGGTLGYVNNTTRRFLRVDRCDLMHPWINDALAQLQERCAETTQLSVRYGVNTGDYLVQPRLVGVGHRRWRAGRSTTRRPCWGRNSGWRRRRSSK